jgi:hypothetical protein
MQTKQFEIFYDILLPFELCKSQARIFWVGVGRGGCTPPRNYLHPQRHLAPPPKVFAPPTNYTYFDLIVSYLIILTTKFVKANIMVSDLAMQA